ncbi:hypothetical protein F511_42413 [Dorcoceras hygrometricum]|uniref:Uncharacterized protein n=1 Tax=Dorcoceras hygrometricum TaxID=472368 RepID=A0A2Z7B7G2_9LAMI|nr:hypothetical protein F511_42413 [Dorcoceras hygrometricum]
MESAVITSALMSSQSAVGYQQMKRSEKEMKRRRAEESADGLREQSQESADTSWKHMFNTSWTTRRKQQQHPVESAKEKQLLLYIQSQALYIQSQALCIQSQDEVTDARFQSQLYIREASLKKVDEKRRVLEMLVQLQYCGRNTLIIQCTNRGKMKRKTKQSIAIREELSRESIAESRLAFPVQARRRKTHVYVVSHTVAAVVHLWSLGVLTAAGCGIGSVHAVVRSNLLVEPSEVEEGEM